MLKTIEVEKEFICLFWPEDSWWVWPCCWNTIIYSFCVMSQRVSSAEEYLATEFLISGKLETQLHIMRSEGQTLFQKSATCTFWKKVSRFSGESTNGFIWKCCNRFQCVYTALSTVRMDILAIVWIRPDVMYSNDTVTAPAHCWWCFLPTCQCTTDQEIITYSQKLFKAVPVLRLRNTLSNYDALGVLQSCHKEPS